MNANHETTISPEVIDPTDLAVAQASSLVAARTLEERRAAPERTTSVGREHGCPGCGSRNVARIAYGLIIAPSGDLLIKLAAGEATLGGCLVARERFSCNACGHRFVHGAEALVEPTRIGTVSPEALER